jgi:hypothetical protein
MTCVILQPSYIPWRGYFHLIQKADVFVFYDDVQFDRNGWRNRNRIKTPRGPEWLTIPVRSAGARLKILEMEVAWEKDWAASHLSKIRQSYARAPFFERYRPMLERWYGQHPEKLADFTIETTIELARELGIRRTQFIRSSTLKCDGAKTGRLVKILKMLGASLYISGPAAKAYLEEDLLAKEGIALQWMTYDYPPYPQLHGDYDPQLSILDLLLMAGPEAPAYIWQEAAQVA